MQHVLKQTQNKIFLAMFLSNLIGMASYLALSVWILRITNSFFLSAALFGCLWILPILWPNGIARLTNHKNIGLVATWSEWGNAILSIMIIIAIVIKTATPVMFMVIIRGFFDALTRTSASLIIKLGEMKPDMVEKNIARVEFWRIMGTSGAGILFSVLANINSEN
ncbi:MAG: hypothetical protein H0Z33_05110 [Bacillaceae bacterium]|nr:hypothetical protein [Bacillaceae bacterium]